MTYRSRLWQQGAWALLAASAAQATDSGSGVPMRDPMRAPVTAQVPARAADAASASAPAELTPRHVMVIDGRRYVIDGGRRLAVGDMLGSARIERIDDGAVWLREAGALRQVSLFGGIAKRMAPSGLGASSPGRTSIPNPTLSTGKRS